MLVDDFLYEKTSLFKLQFQVMVNKSMPTVTRDPLNPLDPSTSGNQVRPSKLKNHFTTTING